MKKLFYLTIILLLAVFVAACGNDQYAIEKQYYQIQKRAAKIFKNPSVSPPQELQRVVASINKFISKNPKDILAVNSEFDIVRLYLAKEEYDKARVYLRAIITKYRSSNAVCSEAQFLLGNSYQAQGKWDLALGEYKKIMQEYPVSVRGLEMPLFIAGYYKDKYQPDKMIEAFRQAIDHYRELATKYPNSALALRVETLIASCYMGVKDWQGAINAYNLIIDKYKSKLNMDGVLMDIALIYSRELKDEAMAKETLLRLISEYPRSRLVAAAKKIIKELDKNGRGKGTR